MEVRHLFWDLLAFISFNLISFFATEKSSETPAPEAATIITSKKAAGNISHLVKKRKKSEEDLAADQAENGDVKKPHLENGASTSNGNGH